MPRDEVPLPKRLVDVPHDPRGFVVPAEAGWEDTGPVIKGVGQSHNFGLAFRRACAGCGYAMKPGETVYRLFNQKEAAFHRGVRANVFESANPGHLICMLYSSLVCPFWSQAQARLGKDSFTAPGAKRGGRPALLGFDDYLLLLPEDSPVVTAKLLYRNLVDDIPYREPSDLTERYEAALAEEPDPIGERSYWTNTKSDEQALWALLERGRRKVQGSKPDQLLQSPDGENFAGFKVPFF